MDKSIYNPGIESNKLEVHSKGNLLKLKKTNTGVFDKKRIRLQKQEDSQNQSSKC